MSEHWSVYGVSDYLGCGSYGSRVVPEVKVHVFCCVLALTLCALLQRESSRHGVERSIPALLDELGGIREVDVLYPARQEGGEPVIKTTLSKMTAEQRRIHEILGLKEYGI